jgi:hypothetical protein
LTLWKYIPIEVVPLAAPAVKRTLTMLGSPNPRFDKAVLQRQVPLLQIMAIGLLMHHFPLFLYHQISKVVKTMAMARTVCGK